MRLSEYSYNQPILILIIYIYLFYYLILLDIRIIWIKKSTISFVIKVQNKVVSLQ